MELGVHLGFIWEYKPTKPEKFASFSQAFVNRSHPTSAYVIILIVTAASHRSMINFKPHKAISNGKVIFQSTSANPPRDFQHLLSLSMVCNGRVRTYATHIAESLWERIKGQKNNVDVIVGVYYILPSQGNHDN